MSSVPSETTHLAPTLHPPRGNYVLVLGLLTFAFLLRVLAQALQYWVPQPWLPAFDRFQGSGSPYWLLLSSQVLILAIMVRTTLRVRSGVQPPRRRAFRFLAWGGSIYMAGSLARLGVGLTFAAPAPWFTAWISAVFHVVLAGFVLTLAAYHAGCRRDSGCRS